MAQGLGAVPLTSEIRELAGRARVSLDERDSATGDARRRRAEASDDELARAHRPGAGGARRWSPRG